MTCSMSANGPDFIAIDITDENTADLGAWRGIAVNANAVEGGLAEDESGTIAVRGLAQLADLDPLQVRKIDSASDIRLIFHG